MRRTKPFQTVKTYFKNNLWMMGLIGSGSLVLTLLGFPFIVCILAPTVCMAIAEIIGDACDYEG